MSQTQDSNALKWSVALACIPTTIVVLLIVLLLRYIQTADLSGAGDGALDAGAIDLGYLIMYGGIAVLVCSLIGVIAAILGWRRTHSGWAWIVLALNIVVPLVIVTMAILALDWYFETHKVEVESLPPIYYAAMRVDVESIKKNLKKGVNVNDCHYDSSQTLLHPAVAAGQMNQ